MAKNKPVVSGFFLLWLCLILTKALFSQFDSTYLVSYAGEITGRFYFSQKETAFKIRETQSGIRLNYKPNTTFNMGVGATYKWFTLNLAYGFNFLNPDVGKGETEYLDLQGHIYGLRWQVDFLGQFYNGFYLNDPALRSADGSYYQRPDIRVREFGLTAQYISNHRRFSYRAGFLQNEWQKKSAGSPLMGWQVLFGSGRADSSLMPGQLADTLFPVGVREMQYIGTGPLLGYAYTFVFREHFFLMASVFSTIQFGQNEVIGPNAGRSSYVLPNLGFRTFVGYNSRKWAIALTYNNDIAQLAQEEAGRRIYLNTANIRLNVVRRFPYHGPPMPIIDKFN